MTGRILLDSGWPGVKVWGIPHGKSIHQEWVEEKQAFLLDLLALRRDRRWRRGLLQGAASFGVISQAEWNLLKDQISDPKPSLGVLK